MTTLVKDLYVFVIFANDLGQVSFIPLSSSVIVDLGLAQSHSDRTLGFNLFSGIYLIMCARESWTQSDREIKESLRDQHSSSPY